MKKSDQELYYATMGRELTKARERMKLTPSQLASKCGEQFNTIKAIEEGKPFYSHQMSWMKSILGMNLNILVADAININSIKEDSDGDEKESNNEKNSGEENSLSSFF